MKPSNAILAAALLFPGTLLAAANAVQPGDATHGAQLFRMHCAQCHGADADGKGYLAKTLTSPAPQELKDPGFLVQRSDQGLHDAIVKGGKATGAHFTMPAFGAQLDSLESWDLVAFLRKGHLSVSDFFPEAAKFAAKTYTLDADSTARLADVLGKLDDGEKDVTIVSVFNADKPSADGPVYVPQEPRELDLLKPKLKAGYLAFLDLQVPGSGLVAVGVSMNKDGVIQKVKPQTDGLKEKDRLKLEKLFAAFDGLGGKKSPERKDYKELKPGKGAPKESAAVAKALTRAYYRALEGAIMFDKDERDRHWAD